MFNIFTSFPTSSHNHTFPPPHPPHQVQFVLCWLFWEWSLPNECGLPTGESQHQNTDTPSPGSYGVLVPQLGRNSCPSFPFCAGIFSGASSHRLAHSVTMTVSSHVQPRWSGWKHCFLDVPHNHRLLRFFYLFFLGDPWALRGRDMLCMPPVGPFFSVVYCGISLQSHSSGLVTRKHFKK